MGGLAPAVARARISEGSDWCVATDAFDRSDVMRTLDPSRGAAGFEESMADSDSTGLIGIAFWCVALAAFLLWALKYLDIRI